MGTYSRLDEGLRRVVAQAQLHQIAGVSPILIRCAVGSLWDTTRECRNSPLSVKSHTRVFDPGSAQSPITNALRRYR